MGSRLPCPCSVYTHTPTPQAEQLKDVQGLPSFLKCFCVSVLLPLKHCFGHGVWDPNGMYRNVTQDLESAC